jgi:hypothetical protein
VRLSLLVETSDGALLPVPPVGAAVPSPGAAPRPSVAPSDPEVRDVVTTDLLDPTRYLSGGELVLTGLAWWRARQPRRTEQFVAALVRAGVAALAAGEAEHGMVPEDVVEACERVGLPLLRVPVAVSFATVTERATRHLSRYRSGDLVAVLSRHRALVAGAAAGPTADSSGLAGILELVARDLALPCWVLSPTGRLVAGGAPRPDEAERRLLARRFLAAPQVPARVVRPGRRTISLYGAGPDSPRLRSWVLAVGEDHLEWGRVRRDVVAELLALVDLERELAATRVSPATALALALIRGTTKPDRPAAPATPADGPDLAEVAARARQAGVDPVAPLAVIVAEGRHGAVVLAEAFGPAEPEHLPDVVALAETGGTALAVVRTGEPSGAVVARLREVVDLLGPGMAADRLVVGVSDPVAGFVDLPAAVVQARAAAYAAGASTAYVSVPHAVAGPDLLSSHTSLLAAVPEGLRRAYRARVLGPLEEHDRAHRAELLRTLEAYLACSGSWIQCAARLHVHVNTLRYRIERIEALTGRDLRRLDDQADLLVALRIPGPDDVPEQPKARRRRRT